MKPKHSIGNPVVADGWELHFEALYEDDPALASAESREESLVHVGMEVIDFRCDPAIVKGGRPPHKQGSTGRIRVRHDGWEHEYFPSVFGCKWVKVPTKAERISQEATDRAAGIL